MLSYKSFYKKLGTRNATDMINPRILKSDELEFPIESILMWVDPSMIPTGPSYTDTMLTTSKLPVVVTPTEYLGESIGNHILKKSININKYILDLKKSSRGFKFIKPGSKNINLNSKKLLIFNFGLINTLYNYTPNPLEDYYRWHNSYNTVILTASSSVTGNGRHKFISLKMPLSIPTRIELDKYTSNMTRQGLDKFSTPAHFNILDLWRMLTPEYKELSTYNNLNVGDYNNITIILNRDNKLSMINLGILFGMVKEYEIESKLNKYPASTVRKMLYVYISKFISQVGKSRYDIDKTESIVDITDGSSDIEDVFIDENIIDDTVNNELVEPVKSVDSGIDEMITSSEVNDIIDDDDIVAYDSIEDVINENIDDKDLLIANIDKLVKNKLISKNKADKLKDSINNQANSYVKYPGEKSVLLKDMLTIKPEELTISEEDKKLPSSILSTDSKDEFDTISVFDKKYINNIYKKDITSTLYSIQSSNIVVNDYDIVKVDSILGGHEEHTINITPLNGSPSKITFKLPIIDENGSFKMSGNNYRIRKQKSDIPIRKISSTRVSLSSYYGKLFITKATHKKDDIGFWFRKQLINKSDTIPGLNDIVLVPPENMGAHLPLTYMNISRYVKSFKLNSYVYNFDYESRHELLKDTTKDMLSKIEKNGMVLIGTNGNNKLFMDKDSVLWEENGSSFKEIDTIYEQLGLDITKAPIEYASVKIYKERIPICVILGYYIGLDKLMKLLGTKYIVKPAKERVNLEKNQFKIVFSDKQLVIDRDYDTSDIIISSLLSIAKILKNIEYKTMNKQSLYMILFNAMNLPILYVNEIKLLNDMYVDPITKSLLENMNEPVTFKGLLIRSCELLTNDNYVNPNDISGMVVKGYERIPGMIYNQLVKSIKEHNNKSIFSKSKINVSPFSVWRNISEDSTTVLVDDLNPISELKQSEDLTYLGFSGRSKEGLSRTTRSLHPSEIGIVSEASKDSGDVGVTMYLSANPKITNVRGLVGKYDSKKDSKGSTMSSTALLFPGSNLDDVKRSNFTNIMASHVIPINNSKINRVRTGYEGVITHRFSEKFIINAKETGIIKDITKKYVEIEYRENVEKVLLKEWTTKEETGSTYTHRLITSLRKGDKINIGDTIAYDEAFFATDIFDKRRVVFKSSTELNVAIMEDIQTFEDSCAISKKSSNKLSTRVTKIKSIIVNSTDEILDIVNVGDKLEPATPLFSISDASVLKLTGLKPEVIEAIKRLKQSTPKSKYRGVVSKITVFYNDEIENMSDTLKSIVETSDKNIRSINKNYSGKVDSGYSIEGNPLQEGNVEIKIYIDVNEGMGVGDKAIFSNQLKSTVGEVYNYNMITPDGQEVEAVFGAKSIAARIVNSPYIIGTTSKLLEVVEDKAIELYFKD